MDSGSHHSAAGSPQDAGPEPGERDAHPAQPRLWPWVAAIAIFGLAIGGGFLLGRATAPGADRLIQSSRERVKALRYDAVLPELTDGRVGRIITPSWGASSKDGASHGPYVAQLKPAAGRTAWIGVSYRNESSRQLIFVNRPDAERQQWGQLYVVGGNSHMADQPSSVFFSEPSQRADLIAQQVAVDPGDWFAIYLVADGGAAAGPKGATIGLESVTLAEGRPERQLTLALPTPLEVTLG